jgi:hypothetical protein
MGGLALPRNRLTTLDAVAAKANMPSLSRRGPHVVRCADGFILSVLSGTYAYCEPRPAFCTHDGQHTPVAYPQPWDGPFSRPCDYNGPFTRLEVGLWADPEPWADWKPYAEDGERIADGQLRVFACVPVDLIRTLIDSHGGES